MTIAQINAAIAAGSTITAFAADCERARRPKRGERVVVTEAFCEADHRRVRVTAQGFKGRFAVRIAAVVAASRVAPWP